jgi:hypothetical protein
VPQDKVDDFLKSLTVVDAVTGEPAPISYPSAGTGGTIDMKVGAGKPGARAVAAPARLARACRFAKPLLARGRRRSEHLPSLRGTLQ